MDLFNYTMDFSGIWEKITNFFKKVKEKLVSPNIEQNAGLVAALSATINELTIENTYLTYCLIGLIGFLIIRWIIRRFI